MGVEQRHWETKKLTRDYTESPFHRWAPDPGFGVHVLIFSHTRGYVEIVEEEIETEQVGKQEERGMDRFIS